MSQVESCKGSWGGCRPGAGRPKRKKKAEVKTTIVLPHTKHLIVKKRARALGLTVSELFWVTLEENEKLTVQLEAARRKLRNAGQVTN